MKFLLKKCIYCKFFCVRETFSVHGLKTKFQHSWELGDPVAWPSARQYIHPATATKQSPNERKKESRIRRGRCRCRRGGFYTDASRRSRPHRSSPKAQPATDIQIYIIFYYCDSSTSRRTIHGKILPFQIGLR